MKNMKRFLIVFMLLVGLAFTSGGVYAITLIPEGKHAFKIEILENNEYQFLYGKDYMFFNDLRVSTNNDVYINGDLWVVDYAMSTSGIHYYNYTLTQDMTFYDTMLYSSSVSFLQAGDIVEIIEIVFSNELTVSTNFNFDSGYMQYSFDGTNYENFPKYPSYGDSFRFDFTSQLQATADSYNVTKIVMYLPNLVKSDSQDNTYQVSYRVYSSNSFGTIEPLDIPSGIVSIEFVSDYDILNSIPYFKTYFKDIHGGIVKWWSFGTSDYLHISTSNDFVLNINYTLDDDYNAGYNAGKGDYGYYDGSNYFTADYYGSYRYNAGLDENRSHFGKDHNGNWLTADQWGNIRYNDGYDKGLSNEIDWFSWSMTFFLMPFRILNIEILPGIRIGYFALFSLLLGVVGWFFFIVGKGGGRKK